MWKVIDVFNLARGRVIANTGFDRLEELEMELKNYRISKYEFQITSSAILIRVVIHASNI
jgi:hypothetical protein